MDLTIEQALIQAVEAQKAGKLQDAEGLYKAILQAEPKHPDANHNLGVLAVSFDKTELALPLFKLALEVKPSQGQFWISYIDALIKTNQLESAKSVIEQGRKMGLAGDAVDALEAQLSPIKKQMPTFAQQIKMASAKKQKKIPTNQANANLIKSPPQSDIDLLIEHYHIGQYVLAENLAKELIKKYPNHQFSWKVLGAVLIQTGKLQDSLLANERALKLSSNDAEVYNNLGITLKELGKLNEAEASYRKAIALKPEYAEAYTNMGITLQELGQLEEAERICTKAILLKHDFAEAHSNLGTVQHKLKRLEKAEASYRKAIEIKPDYAETYSNLGVTLQELGRLEEAEKSVTKAILLKHDFAEAYSYLGSILMDLKRLEKAEASYRKAIEIKPDYAETYSNLGVTLQELGRLEEAEWSFKKAISLKSDYAEAFSNLSTVLIFGYKLNEAAEVLHKIIEIDPHNYGLKACVNLAILNFLDGDLTSCKQLLLSSSFILNIKNIIYKNEIAYWKYLSELLEKRDIKLKNQTDHVGVGKLYVIGESHSLASHGLYVRMSDCYYLCQSIWISGCKQWHLGSFSENQYKYKFTKIIHSIPKDSHILLAIGEIDCRLDDGILKHIKKYPHKNIKGLINSTVINYLNYVYKLIVPFRHKIIIQGIPCPNIDTSETKEKDVFDLVDLIKDFNLTLKKQSIFFGFNFLNLHEMTDRGDGFSNDTWHIDNYHIAPAGMQEAWRSFFIAGKAVE